MPNLAQVLDFSTLLMGKTKESKRKAQEMVWNIQAPNFLLSFSLSNLYAQMQVVVSFLVVKFFGFLKITRHHGSFGGRH